MSKPCVLLPVTDAEVSKLNCVFKKRTSHTVAPYSSARVLHKQQPVITEEQHQILNSISPLAYEIEKQLTRQNICRLFYQWLQKYDAELFNTHSEANISLWLSNLVQALCKMLEYFRCNENLLLASVILCERFLERNGGVKQVHMFDVLFISCLVTVKMWEDSRTSNERAAKLAGKTLQEINMMERVFLGKIDYALYISSNQMQEFHIKINNNHK